MKDSKDAWPYSDNDDDDVTASEVAAYTYCAKAWHLERVPQNLVDSATTARRIAGADRHVEHGTRLARLSRFGRGTVWASTALLVIAAILIAAALLL